MLDPARALLRGVPTQIATGVNATGNNQSNPFSILKSQNADGKIRLQGIGTFTALVATVDMSMNGGTNWFTGPSVDLNANNPADPAPVFNASPGILYRLTFTTVTQTVPPNVLAVLV